MRAPRRRWRSSIRLRYATVATLLAGMTFAGGGAIALALYRHNLISGVQQAVRSSAQAVAAAAQRGPLPVPIPMPVAAGVPRIQILDAAGRVVTGDPASVNAPPMTAFTHGAPGHVADVANPANLPAKRAAVVAVQTTSPTGPLTIVVAASLDAADTKINQALGLSLALAAISLTTVAAVAWLTTGRTLRRVERMRAEVSTITANGDLTQRVVDAGTDELAELGTTLNHMLATMADAADRQRRFIADAAHELRTPLSGIGTTLDVAIHHPETVERDQWIAELAAGQQRLALLVNDLLELAGLDGNAPRRRRPIDLAGVVTDAVRRPVPGGVQLGVATIQPSVVEGEESQLARIAANLIDNAVRHASRAVEVALVREPTHAVLSVADDGPGIPLVERERIWGRFVRLETHRSRSAGGSGLGLALVKELVEAHGGTVAVSDSAELGGARFVVRLPLASGQTVKSAR